MFSGKIYDGKFYILNDNDQSEVYDFKTMTWNFWPAIPRNTGVSPCMVNWRDNLIVFGGLNNQDGVQLYNIPTQVM